MKSIIVCDDNDTFISLLKELLNEYFRNKKQDISIRYFHSGEELLETDAEKMDIAFLDIEMENLNGIQTGYELQKRNPDIILFIVTSYTQYLDDAMDLRVFRYFNKPIDKRRLYRGLDIALREKKKINIKTKNGYELFKEDEIVCVYKLLRKTVVLTKIGDTFQTCYTIKDWCEILSGNNTFFSPHYSYIVNLDYVKGLSDKTITLECKNGKQMKIHSSKRKYSEFKRAFNEKMREYR